MQRKSIEDMGFQIEMKRWHITELAIKEAIRQTKGNRVP